MKGRNIKTLHKLKEMIDMNGPDYLIQEPYEACRELVRSGDGDQKIAAGLLCCLFSGIGGSSLSDEGPEDLSDRIRKTCGFNKRTADQLAEILLLLYSEENKEAWEKKDGEGLAAFLQEEFKFTWKGFAIWDGGSVTLDCIYEADITLMPEESLSENHALLKRIKRNAFLTKEKIHDFFEKELRDYLDYEFKDFCTEDDYYEPVAEDFDIDYCLREWCGKNGFCFVSCEGKGYDNGFEPKDRGRHWY